MSRRRATLVCSLLTVATSAWAQQIQWRDASPHKTTFVEVENDVRLEVLDWGGSGPALMLLTGLGDSVHVFDDVAPMLATRYRVVGVNRRGHPGSSAPATGYDSARLAEDVVRVMDAVGLPRPIVVGHSYAGEEMHVLGARYPTRIAALVYVDAAFDRGDVFEPYEKLLPTFPSAPRPQPADLASFDAVRDYLTRTQGPPGPEARLRARWMANPDGTIRGPWAPEPQVFQGFSAESKAMVAAYHPDRIRVPALALYAVPESASELMRPWYDATDPTLKERVERLYQLNRENAARHEKWFAAFSEQGRIAEVPGGHDLFVANPHEVIRQLNAFVSSLPSTH